jgi:hypothetical protein
VVYEVVVRRFSVGWGGEVDAAGVVRAEGRERVSQDEEGEREKERERKRRTRLCSIF